MKKIFQLVFVAIGSGSFIWGLFLAISNIQGTKICDGYPLDPQWMINLLLIYIPIACVASIILFCFKPQQKRFKTANGGGGVYFTITCDHPPVR